MSDDVFTAPVVTEISRHQISGRYLHFGEVALIEDWTGTCPRLGKMLIVKMSDGSFMEASTKQTLCWSEQDLSPTFAWFEVSGAAGLRVLPHQVEQLVEIGMVADWRAAALHEANLRRAVGA